MKLIKLLTLLYFFFIILAGCSGGEVGKILRNEKTITADEFLIEKKGPLSQPPDFQKIPQPGSIENKAEKVNEIDKILKARQPENSSSNNQSSSTEDSILRQIKK